MMVLVRLTGCCIQEGGNDVSDTLMYGRVCVCVKKDVSVDVYVSCMYWYFCPTSWSKNDFASDGDQELVFDVELSNMALQWFLTYIIKHFFQFYLYSVILFLICYHSYYPFCLIALWLVVVSVCSQFFCTVVGFFLYFCSRHRWKWGACLIFTDFNKRLNDYRDT